MEEQLAKSFKSAEEGLFLFVIIGNKVFMLNEYVTPLTYSLSIPARLRWAKTLEEARE